MRDLVFSRNYLVEQLPLLANLSWKAVVLLLTGFLHVNPPVSLLQFSLEIHSSKSSQLSDRELLPHSSRGLFLSPLWLEGELSQLLLQVAVFLRQTLVPLLGGFVEHLSTVVISNEGLQLLSIIELLQGERRALVPQGVFARFVDGFEQEELQIVQLLLMLLSPLGIFLVSSMQGLDLALVISTLLAAFFGRV